jgi:asparagine synthetase B (glutamine-hydrolysing)
MSSFLTIRYVYDAEPVAWKEGIVPVNNVVIDSSDKKACKTADDIDEAFKSIFEKMDLNNAAILLSGGIDSGILASYMPEGTKAYTAHNKSELTDLEVQRAADICKRNNLDHRVVEIDWEYYDNNMDRMMMKANCPVTANEPQVNKLVKQAVDDGAKLIIFGDSADMVFGGMDQLLSKNWTFMEWVNRYTFVDPNKVLKNPISMMDIYEPYRVGYDGIDFMRFLDDIFTISSGNAYYNAFKFYGIDYFDPYTRVKMAEPLDLNRVRNGESKYLLRALYAKKYPDFKVPEKLPMPRSMNLWLDWWEGPTRPEFIPSCIEGLTYEQRFLVYSLERYLNLIEGE